MKKKLTLKRTQTLFIFAFLLALLLLLFGGTLDSAPLLIISFILIALDMIMYFIFWRCPHCARYLGRDVGEFCTHCGKKLEEERR